jgi:thioredoxin-related protein
MDFARLDWKEKELCRALLEKYGVTGMPTLVLLDKDGNEISRSGRELVTAKGVQGFSG